MWIVPNKYLWLVNINVDLLPVYNFAGCVRLFVPRTTELFLSINCKKASSESDEMKWACKAVTLMWVFMKRVAVKLCRRS